VIDANGKILFCSIGANNSYPYLHMVTDKNINALKNIDNYTENWKLQISQTANERLSPPVIGRDNTIYINSTANKIYAINIPPSP
jgi:outer membrane protein assembly factor BamB